MLCVVLLCCDGKLVEVVVLLVLEVDNGSLFLGGWCELVLVVLVVGDICCVCVVLVLL